VSYSILFDGRLILDKPTGIGQYLVSLLPELVESNRDWEFQLLCRPDPWPGYQLEDLISPNLKRHISSLKHMSLRQHYTIPTLARDLQADLIHYPHMDAPVIFGSIPVVATIHDAKNLGPRDEFQDVSAVKRAYLRFACKQTLSRATAVIADSYNTVGDLKSLFPEITRKIHVVHLAANSALKKQSLNNQEATFKRYGITRPFILSVGEFRPHKNHVGLIKAYHGAECSQTHNLLLVGQLHKDYDAPQKIISELGLEDQVRILTDVSADDLPSLYSGADLFVLVSYYEGFGLPVLEAMACGCPVIASNTTALKEVAGGGAYLIDPDNQSEITHAIDEIISNEDRRKQLVHDGEAWSSQFSWKKTADKTLAVYESVLSKK
jgi:glycosyltransferase involved in cell wall biosynthesis